MTKRKALKIPLFVFIIFNQIRKEKCVSKAPHCMAVSSCRQQSYLKWHLLLPPHLQFLQGYSCGSYRLALSVIQMGPEFLLLTPSLLSSWRIITLVSLSITSSSSWWEFSPPQQFLLSHKQNLRFSNGHSSYPYYAAMRLIAQSYSNSKEHKLIK